MATQVPIRCYITLTLTVDIDITQQTTLNNKLTQLIQDLKTQFQDKIAENQISVQTGFKTQSWKV